MTCRQVICNVPSRQLNKEMALNVLRSFALCDDSSLWRSLDDRVAHHMDELLLLQDANSRRCSVHELMQRASNMAAQELANEEEQHEDEIGPASRVVARDGGGVGELLTDAARCDADDFVAMLRNASDGSHETDADVKKKIRIVERWLRVNADVSAEGSNRRSTLCAALSQHLSVEALPSPPAPQRENADALATVLQRRLWAAYDCCLRTCITAPSASAAYEEYDEDQDEEEMVAALRATAALRAHFTESVEKELIFHFSAGLKAKPTFDPLKPIFMLQFVESMLESKLEQLAQIHHGVISFPHCVAWMRDEVARLVVDVYQLQYHRPTEGQPLQHAQLVSRHVADFIAWLAAAPVGGSTVKHAGSAAWKRSVLSQIHSEAHTTMFCKAAVASAICKANAETPTSTSCSAITGESMNNNSRYWRAGFLANHEISLAVDVLVLPSVVVIGRCVTAVARSLWSSLIMFRAEAGRRLHIAAICTALIQPAVSYATDEILNIDLPQREDTKHLMRASAKYLQHCIDELLDVIDAEEGGALGLELAQLRELSED